MTRSRNALALTAIALACAQASALDFKTEGGLEGKLTTVLTFGTQVRLEDPSPDAYSATPAAAIGAPAGRLQGQTGGSNLNYAKGDAISTVAKAVVDLDLKKDGVGLFVRASAWKDFVQGEDGVAYGNYPSRFTPGAPLADSGFGPSGKFSGAQVRDAFAYGSFKLDGGRTLEARLGRQVLSWGASQLTTGGINSSINPLDYSAQLRPGALPVEGKVPLGMLSAKLASGAAWTLEGFAAYESRESALPGCGTYFDVASYAPEGCAFATLAAFGFERNALAANNYLHRSGDVRGSSTGQFGLAWGTRSEALAADLKFYAMNTHSAMPGLRFTVNTSTPGILASNYSALFAENIKTYGMSFSKKLDAASNLYGEVAYRPNQALNLNAYDLVAAFVTRAPNSVLALNKGVLGIPVGGTFDAFDRFGVTNLTVGANKVLPKALGADRLLLVGEVGLSRVNGLPPTTQLRYGRPLPYNGAGYTGGPACADAVAGKTCTSEGYVSSNAWGVRLLASATYGNALWGGTVTPSLLLAKDVKGWSHDGTFSEGRALVRPGMRMDWRNQYFADVSYSRFTGGKYNLLVDRDYLALAVGARF